MSENLKLGQIITTPQERDAIHIAVIPLTAGCDMKPGQWVETLGGEASWSSWFSGVGVVDPFLTKDVKKGDQFWCYLRPGSITSLRHDWTHPAFPAKRVDQSHMGESERWLRAYAEEVGRSYAVLLDAARQWVRYRDYLHGGSENEGLWVPDAFWQHYENVTGEKVEEDKRGSFFSCSC